MCILWNLQGFLNVNFKDSVATSLNVCKIKVTHFSKPHQGLYSLSGKTSYRKISRSLEAAIFGLYLFQSLWNLAGTSAALLPRCLSNFRAIRPLQHPISRLRDFTRFGGKTSYRLVNRGPVLKVLFPGFLFLPIHMITHFQSNILLHTLKTFQEHIWACGNGKITWTNFEIIIVITGDIGHYLLLAIKNLQQQQSMSREISYAMWHHNACCDLLWWFTCVVGGAGRQ